jgi:hypothetical protein
MAKNRRVKATSEEEEIMRRAEARASEIEKKTAERQASIPSFNEEAERQRVIESKRQPGLTIVEGAESGMPGQKKREESLEQKTTTYTPQQVANSVALQNVLNDRATDASNEILDKGTKNAESLEELDEVENLANQAKQEEEKEKTNIQNQIYTGPAAGLINATALARSEYLKNIGQQQGGSPSYIGDQGNKDDIDKKIIDDASNQMGYVPSAVIEKLGVQDYYPQVGRDIAVGTFTGSRIGSQTIYSGAGALLPMGLYDARKRALAQAAKDKQAAVDKYFDLIETAPQYQEKFNVSTMDWMNDNLYNKHKGNSDAFLKDPEVRREYARRKGLAKELTHYSTWSESLLKDAADEKKYVTKEMIDVAGQIKSALVNNADDVVSGKIDLGPLFAKAKVYQNIIPQIDEVTKQVLAAERMGKSPINLKTGGEYDKESFKKEAADFINKVNVGDIDHVGFITGFKKYFTGDYEQIIDGLIESGKYSEEQREAALDYFAGQLQEQVDFDTKILGTKAFDREALAERRRQFDLDYNRKIQEGKTHWQARNEQMNFIDKQTGKSMAQIMDDLKKKGIKGDKFNNQILSIMRRNGITNATIDPYTNSVVIREKASSYEEKNPVSVNNASVRYKLKYKDKNGKTVQTTVRAVDLPGLDLSGKKYYFDDGVPLTKDVQAKFKKAMELNRSKFKTNQYEIAYGMPNPKDRNDITNINGDNIDYFNPNKMVFTKKSVGRLSYYIVNDEGKAAPVTLPGTAYFSSEFSSESGINSNDKNWGQGLKSEEGFGLGGGNPYESWSSSSSLENE